MPRLPIDYANTIIYKIVCNDLIVTECYVGHTTDFIRRKHEHKRKCRVGNSDYKIYVKIRENGGWDNYSMIEVEKYPCKDRNEACAKEREWFEILNSKLNTNFPQRSYEEWYKVNKEELFIKNKQYVEDNRETIAEYKKQYAEENRDKIVEYKAQHYENNKIELLIKQNQYHKDNRETILIKQKQYVKDNKLKIIEQQKKHREDNKEEIKERKRKTFICECGVESTQDHKSRHLKSIFHIRYIENIKSSVVI